MQSVRPEADSRKPEGRPYVLPFCKGRGMPWPPEKRGPPCGQLQQSAGDWPLRQSGSLPSPGWLQDARLPEKWRVKSRPSQDRFEVA